MSEHEKAIKAVAKELLAHGEFGTTDGANRTNARKAAEAAISAYLAACNAEPVGYVEERGIRKLAGNSPTAVYPQKDEWFNIPLFPAPPAPAEAKVDAVGIKPLEWEILTTNAVHIAKTGFGFYRVEDNGTHCSMRHDGDDEASMRSFESLGLAKATAQSDYEARIRAALIPSPSSSASEIESFQQRVSHAHYALFDDDPTDIEERRARFYEEATETVQAFGMTTEDMHKIVEYSGNRPVGEPAKEIGGAMVTLASLCVVAGFDMSACAEADLEKLQRPETIARIKAKRATRHGRGPLPGLDPNACKWPSCGCAMPCNTDAGLLPSASEIER